MEWIFDLSRIDAVARDFWTRVGECRVFAFHGAMGAGKTTFIHQLCRVAGVTDPIGSPTFSLVNEYHMKGERQATIRHIDLYRLRDEAEAFDAGIEDCLFSGDICLVEWPERAPALFPEDTVHVYLEVLDGGMRKIRVHIDRDNQ
jgi:tRNA threonylcarbamoyladenosine biosynthesis protein TsaE